MKIGAQLYTVRNFIKTKSDLEQTIIKLKDMGYECVQFSGAEYNAEELAELSKKYDMPVVLTHVSIDRICDDTEKIMEEHRLFGCSNIGIGALPMPCHFNEEETLAFIEKIREPIEKLDKAGFKLFYHNHDFDLYRFSGGKKALDLMAEKLPKLNLTLDTFWLQQGGVSVTDYLEKYEGRTECIHLKDMRLLSAEGWNLPEHKFAPIGEGNLNWKQIMSVAEKTGVKYALVEQDDAVDYDDPFAQLASSANYLKKMGYIK